MEANDMDGFEDVEQYFVEKHLAIINDIGVKHIVWQDPLENNVTVRKQVKRNPRHITNIASFRVGPVPKMMKMSLKKKE
jgi:hypothetical protein